MKRFFISLAILSLLTITVSYSQVRLGIRGGVNASQLNSDVEIQTPDFKVSFPKYVMLGYHVGLIGQIQLFNFFIQPEALYTVTRNDIDIYDLSSANPDDAEQVTLTLNHIDIPIMLGLKGKVFKVGIGPVFTFHISDDSDLEKITHYDLQINNATVGFQAGIGFDIRKIAIDFKYEGSLGKLGDGIKLGNGERMAFDSRLNQVIASIGLFF
jgi:hypothetical protein